jgi:hypothetical protein
LLLIKTGLQPGKEQGKNMDRFFLATNPLNNGSPEYVIDNIKCIYFRVKDGNLILPDSKNEIEEVSLLSSYKQAQRWYRSVLEQKNKKPDDPRYP